jgi:hypothetical protein
MCSAHRNKPARRGVPLGVSLFVTLLALCGGFFLGVTLGFHEGRVDGWHTALLYAEDPEAFVREHGEPFPEWNSQEKSPE